MPTRSVTAIAALVGAAVFTMSAAAAETEETEASEASEASDQQEAAPPEWSGSISLGAVATSGSTDSEATNGAIDAVLEYTVWRHKLQLRGYRASEEGETTAERYSGAWQTDYKFSERSYFFGNANYQRDRFGAFERSASVSIGVGRRFVETDSVELDAELGAGRRYQEAQGADDFDGDSIARFQSDFLWRFSDTAEFTQSIAVESGESNTTSESVTAVESQLTGALAFRLSHTIEHDTEVPPGEASTDRITAASVEYAF